MKYNNDFISNVITCMKYCLYKKLSGKYAGTAKMRKYESIRYGNKFE